MRTDCFDNKSVILMRNYFNYRVFFPKTIALLRNYDKLWYKLSTVVQVTEPTNKTSSGEPDVIRTTLRLFLLL